MSTPLAQDVFGVRVRRRHRVRHIRYIPAAVEKTPRASTVRCLPAPQVFLLVSRASREDVALAVQMGRGGRPLALMEQLMG